jgi:hypothetical protein
MKAVTSEPWHAIDAYDEALRSVLEAPSLQDGASDARWVLRCLFKPVFHTECWIALVERDDTAVEMTLRVPTRPIWAFVRARQGLLHGNPVTDWVEPAISTEAIAVGGVMPWRAMIDAIAREAFPDVTSSGIDGMGVTVLLWRSGIRRSWELWFGRFDERDGRHRLLRATVETARSLTVRAASVAALEHVRGSLGI